MKITGLFFLLTLLLFSCAGPKSVEQQKNENASEPAVTKSEWQDYRAAYTNVFDLEHTRLEVKPDWSKKELAGKATITLHPHFYPCDSLSLNARMMILNEVSIVLKNGMHAALQYSYDDKVIHIKLGRMYKREESFQIFIDYVSRPEKLKQGGSVGIKSDKGLFFINADGKDPYKPQQLWTQGETESNSAWFPTIESPQQKMTQEVYITVDSSFQTVSNGLLLSSEMHPDGTRTDYWKQSLPAAPYLCMIAVGRFAIVRERWRNIEISYYVDPPYEKYVPMIFGHTPEMLTFFSAKLGIDFLWEKYAQIVAHDYVSGAMENTTAVIQGTNMQQDSSEYYDGNYEEFISHEIFHHWFGDLVTCKSWSNITLNEGFANYAEYLWNEYKYGREEADFSNQLYQSIYFYAASRRDPPLIRYHYDDREDVYDEVSYQKGGRILHMLRKYVGDDAFFSALHLYLETNKFGVAEVDDLRHAFETITGEDLHWFFTEWYLHSGTPSLDITYNWDEGSRKEKIVLEQKQDLHTNAPYRLPIDIDFYFKDTVERHRVVVQNAKEEITLTLKEKPLLVNVDAEKMLLSKKADHKTNEEFIYQYYHAPLFLDRFEAVWQIGDDYRAGTPEAKMMLDALHDHFWNIRLRAVQKIGELAKNIPDSVRPLLVDLSTRDSSSHVRDAALEALDKYYKYTDVQFAYANAFRDKSCMVVARVLRIEEEKNPGQAMKMAALLEEDSCNDVLTELSHFYSTDTTSDKNTFYQRAYRQGGRFGRSTFIKNYGKYLLNTPIDTVPKNGINYIAQQYPKETSKRTKASWLNVLKDIRTDLEEKIKIKNKEIDEMRGTRDAQSLAVTESQRKIISYQSTIDLLNEKINSLENTTPQ